MVNLLCGTILMDTSNAASYTYGSEERMPTSKPSLFDTGALGYSDGSPCLISNTPSFVKYNLSILPR